MQFKDLHFFTCMFISYSEYIIVFYRQNLIVLLAIPLTSISTTFYLFIYSQVIVIFTFKLFKCNQGKFLYITFEREMELGTHFDRNGTKKTKEHASHTIIVEGCNNLFQNAILQAAAVKWETTRNKKIK